MVVSLPSVPNCSCVVLALMNPSVTQLENLKDLWTLETEIHLTFVECDGQERSS